jgi:hypothetical protein
MSKLSSLVRYEFPFDLAGGIPAADLAARYSSHIITADPYLSGMTQLAALEHDLHNPLSSL